MEYINVIYHQKKEKLWYAYVQGYSSIYVPKAKSLEMARTFITVLSEEELQKEVIIKQETIFHWCQ